MEAPGDFFEVLWNREPRCDCGRALDHATDDRSCPHRVAEDDAVYVDFLPEYLRPGNDIDPDSWYRLRVTRECADRILSAHPEWTKVG